MSNGYSDVAQYAKCVIGCSIQGWKSTEFREEIDALTLQYIGSGASASVELTGGNNTNNRLLTAMVNGAAVGSFTINTGEAAFDTNTNYTVKNVVDWLNRLPDWTATLLDNSRYAASLSVAANQLLGGAFKATDAKSGPLKLVTAFDFHSDLWQSSINGNGVENLIYFGNNAFDNVVQSVFVASSVGAKDCIIANNTFDQDEFDQQKGILFSQVDGPHSHVCIIHNTWSNQSLILRNDRSYAPDQYCAIANNVLPALQWVSARNQQMAAAHNHLFAGATIPSGAVGTIATGTKQTLEYAILRVATLRRRGELLANLVPPFLQRDAAGNLRSAYSPAGAWY